LISFFENLIGLFWRNPAYLPFYRQETNVPGQHTKDCHNDVEPTKQNQKDHSVKRRNIYALKQFNPEKVTFL